MAPETNMRPPINRSMRILDRAFFTKSVSLTAARVHQLQHISPIRAQLLKTKELLSLDRIAPIRPDPSSPTHKCLLLQPSITSSPATWSPTLTSLLTTENRMSLIPYTLELDYRYWTYLDIISAILPEEAMTEDIPTSFQLVGHVAHLNLREHSLPHKELIAQVLMDKNPSVRTVINKLDNVGSESEYRTFAYEVLAGPDDMQVEVKEQGCVFGFDYSKVYWNSRLSTEHERLVGLFDEGEAVCDVMAGIGPFALPAGKRRCWVWANDKNPESFKALEVGIGRNKVGGFVRGFNRDGRDFIPWAIAELAKEQREVKIGGSKRRGGAEKDSAPPVKVFTQPKTFSHFVMNLPASATTFLPAFRGAYAAAGLAEDTPMPKVHVYCFDVKSDDVAAVEGSVRKEVSRQLGYDFKPEEVDVFDVRDVAPKKRMFCASFTLPREVAFEAVADGSPPQAG